MSDIRYNISELFQLAFGLNNPVYITQPLSKEISPSINFDNIEVLPDYYNPDAISWMGTPIMFQATFEGDSYQKYNKDGTMGQKSMESFNLPPSTMFTFRRAKNIIRTNVLGSNGTVKEIFGFDDWVIDVRGLCLDDPNIGSARDQLKVLLEWESLASSIGVLGSEFKIRGIDSVCISEWSDYVPQGKPSVVAFQFQLYSDDNKLLQMYLGD